MNIDDSLLNAEVIDKDGYPYLIHPLTDGVPACDPNLLREFAAWAAVQPMVEHADVLVTPEAMGIPLAAATSLLANKPYVVIRKRSYELPGETLAYCETGYGESCLYINDLKPGQRVVLVDDVLSTGGTLDSVLATLHSMAVTVDGVLIFLDKGHKRAELEAKFDVPVVVMRTINIRNGQVEIVETT